MIDITKLTQKEASMDTDAILSVKLPDNTKSESGARTVGGYLANLLLTLIEEGEGFSGKRPFGNSGWDVDVPIALIFAGYSDIGTVQMNEYEEIEDYDINWKVYEALITRILREKLGA